MALKSYCGVILLSLLLVLAPGRCIDHLVTHELCHLISPDDICIPLVCQTGGRALDIPTDALVRVVCGMRKMKVDQSTVGTDATL